MNAERANDTTGFFSDIHGPHALAAARLQPVFIKVGAFTQPVFGGDQQHPGRIHDRKTDHKIIAGWLDAPHASGRPAHRPDTAFLTAQTETLRGDKNQFIRAIGQFHADQGVAFLNVNGVDPRLTDVPEVPQRRLFDNPHLGGKNHKTIFPPDGTIFLTLRLEPENRRNLFVGLQVEHVLDRTASRHPRHFRNLIHPLHVDPSRIGEKHQDIMRIRRDETFDKISRLVLVIGLADGHAFQPFAPTILRTILAGQRALDIPAMTQRDDRRLVGDQVRNVDFALFDGKICAPRRGILGLHRQQFGANDAQHTFLARQNVHQILDRPQQRPVFVDHLPAVQRRQLIQPQLQNVLDLAVGENISISDHTRLPADQDSDLLRRFRGKFIRFQAAARLVPVVGITNDLDEIIQAVERQQIRLQLFRVTLSHRQQPTRTPDHHLPAVLKINSERMLEIEQARTAVIDRQHVDGERCLERRMLKKIIDDDLRAGVFFQLHHHPGPIVRLVAHPADFRQNFLIGEGRNSLHQLRPVHRIRNLRNDDDLAPRLRFFHRAPPPHFNRSAATMKILARPLHAVNHAARRKIRPLHMTHQRLHRQTWVVNQRAHRINHLPQIVRRNISGHAHRNTRPTVNQ